MKDILDVKKNASAFKKHLDQYAYPKCNFILGLVMVTLTSTIAPMYGWFMMGCMNDMNVAAFKNESNSSMLKQGLITEPVEEESVLDAVLPWVMFMILAAVVIGITTTLSKMFMS